MPWSFAQTARERMLCAPLAYSSNSQRTIAAGFGSMTMTPSSLRR